MIKSKKGTPAFNNKFDLLMWAFPEHEKEIIISGSWKNNKSISEEDRKHYKRMSVLFDQIKDSGE